MLEIVLLAVIVVGLYRRGGERWEWNRARLHRAFTDLGYEGERAVASVRRAGPGVITQCVADMRSLGQDMVAVLDPKTRRRLERGARRLAARSARHRSTAGEVGALTAGGPVSSGGSVAQADPAFARLQQRYLEGGISLDEYVAQAGQLRGEEPGD